VTLKGKNALVTGSTSGMGLGIAKALAEAGANVMMNGFGDADLIKKCMAEVKGDRAIKVAHEHADLSKPAEVVGLVQTAEKALGSVDILVNNAGIQHVAPIEDFPAERWDALIAVNLSAAFHATRAALPGMRKHNWGRIVNNASASGLHAAPFKTAYCASKFGIIGLTKAVALETAETFITCNAICPGWVMSGMSRPQIEVIAQREGVSFEKASEILVSGQPNKRFIKPAEIGALVVYLCSDAAGPITGSACEIDGGIAAK
jgi:3-hydroxybutyrate dehydrogenase